LVREFEFWRIKRGIGWDGRLFLWAVDVKKRFRALLSLGIEATRRLSLRR
jgi:hypothetical protein